MAEASTRSAPPSAEDVIGDAVAVAEAAGPVALRYFRRALDVEDKSGGQRFDPVTRADREVESRIREELERRFPDHGIVGEEHAERVSDSACRWIIDPIDGTRAFISGFPAWGILLGYTVDGVPRAGVLHQPYLGETFYGAGDRAVLRRGGEEIRLRTSATAELADAVLYCTHPSMYERRAEIDRFDALAGRVRLPRFGGDCYSYGLLAHGLVDLVVEGAMQPYDIVPLIPIVEAAGGIVTTWDGGDASGGGLVLAAANRSLHAQALEILRGAAPPIP